MTGDVHAWARERLADAVGDALPTKYSAQERRFGLPVFDVADAVLAVLPKLLTDQRVSLAIWRRCPDMILHADVDAVLVCAAETLAGVS